MNAQKRSDRGEMERMSSQVLDPTDLQIRTYPDPVLKTPATPVESFGPELAAFVEEMLTTMKMNNGAGLAAPQVGVSKKIAVIGCEESFYVLINPRLLEQAGEQEGEEGCLSFPGIFATVKRPARVKVAAQDVMGEEHVYEVEGYPARAFLHEMDHLEGKLFIERLSALKRGMIRKKMYKRVQDENK